MRPSKTRSHPWLRILPTSCERFTAVQVLEAVSPHQLPTRRQGVHQSITHDVEANTETIFRDMVANHVRVTNPIDGSATPATLPS